MPDYSEFSPKPDQTPNLDKEVLDALELTPEDVENYNQQKKRLRMSEEAGRNEAKNYYHLVTTNQKPPMITLYSYSIPPGIATNELADYAQDMMKNSNESLTDPSTENGYRARGFIEGLGYEAMANQDWLTAVKSLDSITEGGIRHNAEAMNGLRQAAIKNKEQGMKIAVIIQRRIDERNPKPETITPSSNPTPEPELRQVPPQPSYSD